MTPAVRHDGWTPLRKAQFLDQLATEGNVRVACARVGMSPEAAYKLRRRDFAFAESWDTALVQARGHVAQVLADRALNGVAEAIWYRGELVGQRLRFDTRLLLAHMARLDRMADDDRAAERARRFDEMLALVAGETFPADMADEDEEDGAALAHAADPLLPKPRERHIEDAARLAAAGGRDAALAAAFAEAEAAGEIEEDWRDHPHHEELLSDERYDAACDAEDAAAARGRAEAEAAWDDWRARTDALVAALDAGDGAGEAAGAAVGPIEYKSLEGPGDASFWTPSTASTSSVFPAVPPATPPCRAAAARPATRRGLPRRGAGV